MLTEEQRKNKKRWYVYEWYLIDTEEVFYVGQGTLGRYKTIKGRPQEFIDIYENNKCDVRIIVDNITQEDSWDLEEKQIARRLKEGHPLVNIHKGGKIIGACGEDNPAYGKIYTDDERQALREANLGEKNPMHGISPKERMDAETYKQWRQKQKDNKQGEKNPNYGKHTLHKIYSENPELSKEKQSRPGAQNGKAKKIALYENGIFIKAFGCIKDCAQYLYDLGYTKYKVKNLTGHIPKSIKTNKPLFNKFTFEFIK